MRRFLALLVLVLAAPLLLGACSDDSDSGSGSGDGGGGDDVEAFCDQVIAVDEMEDPSSEEALDALNQLVDDAPSEIKDDLEVLLPILEDLEGLDEDDPEAFGEVLALMENEEFIEASENLEAFGVEECGLEPSSTTDTFSSEGTELEVD
jgi:hypothetical protein